jgi:hypothetical protein
MGATSHIPFGHLGHQLRQAILCSESKARDDPVEMH